MMIQRPWMKSGIIMARGTAMATRPTTGTETRIRTAMLMGMVGMVLEITIKKIVIKKKSQEKKDKISFCGCRIKT
jgi:hypothetical protein